MGATSDNQQRGERNAGLLLIAAAVAALMAANSPFQSAYQNLLHYKVGPSLPRYGQFDLHHWIADGLMAVFFLLVGLEVKREWYEGRLSRPAERRMPIIAAMAGMAVPALIYVATVGGDPTLVKGWAIPAATDIAFAIGVLAILGRHAPASIKLLLVTIAIVDDIGAVLVIALFYSAGLNLPALFGTLALVGVMTAMGRLGVRRLWPFMIGFALLWLLVLASGVHATIAGVLAALAVPLASGEAKSPLKRLEHAIHPWVMFGIVPIFGLASAGVELSGVGALAHPLPLAILAGLFLGKQIGIFGAIWAADRSAIARRPDGASWRQLYGAALLCGIGFTMSLFIGALAFPADQSLVDEAKLGTLAGSLISAIAGYLILRLSPPAIGNDEDEDEAGEIFGTDQHDALKAIMSLSRIWPAVRKFFADLYDRSTHIPVTTHDYFLSTAQSQVIEDVRTAECWELILEGIRDHCLGPGNITEVISSLRRGWGRGFNEFYMGWVEEWENKDPGLMEVFFVNDTRWCPGNLLIAELEQLRQRYYNKLEDYYQN